MILIALDFFGYYEDQNIANGWVMEVDHVPEKREIFRDMLPDASPIWDAGGARAWVVLDDDGVVELGDHNIVVRQFLQLQDWSHWI